MFRSERDGNVSSYAGIPDRIQREANRQGRQGGRKKNDSRGTRHACRTPTPTPQCAAYPFARSPMIRMKEYLLKERMSLLKAAGHKSAARNPRYSDHVCRRIPANASSEIYRACRERPVDSWMSKMMSTATRYSFCRHLGGGWTRTAICPQEEEDRKIGGIGNAPAKSSRQCIRGDATIRQPLRPRFTNFRRCAS